jgi:hypothetical protein
MGPPRKRIDIRPTDSATASGLRENGSGILLSSINAGGHPAQPGWAASMPIQYPEKAGPSARRMNNQPKRARTQIRGDARRLVPIS